jgi:hypothetical protein
MIKYTTLVCPGAGAGSRSRNFSIPAPAPAKSSGSLRLQLRLHNTAYHIFDQAFTIHTGKTFHIKGRVTIFLMAIRDVMYMFVTFSA